MQMVLVLVSLHVQGKVVRSGEGAGADGALEGFGARVFPVVSGQLIGASETPVAAVPRAAVRLLTCREEKKEGLSETSQLKMSKENTRGKLKVLHNLMITNT